MMRLILTKTFTNMKPENYKYLVALSFATEDAEIAQEISNELNRLQIKNYLYLEENIVGRDIKKKTWEVYREKSMFALMLISKDYVKKKWADEERQAMQTVNRPEGVPYIIPLRLDDTPVEGLSNNIAYWEWQGNASYIAVSLFELVRPALVAQITEQGKKKKKKRETKKGNTDYNVANSFEKIQKVVIDQSIKRK